MGEPYEVELKFACSALDRVRSTLRELGATKLVPRNFEDNWVFDRDGALQKQQCVLRLREDHHGSRLTFKGPPQFAGGVKTRTEHETKVESSATLRKILESLGWAAVQRYQKYREEWSQEGVEIALDETPMGTFVEFEGPAAEELARRAGFDPEQAETLSYLELWERYRVDHPSASKEMVFS